VWRRAPGRAWRRGGSGPLLLLAVLAATTSAASAPLFVQLSGDDALTTVRSALPVTARTADSDSVRIVSGAAPTDAEQERSVRLLSSIPGLTTPATLAFSVAPEVRYSEFVRPVVRANGMTVRARLTAVESPETSLVAQGQTRGEGSGVWLPAPVAEQLGVAPGDTVELLVLTRDATHAPPKGAKPDPVARVVVDGVYATGTDGRRPADPPGTAVWSRRVGGIPTDTEFLNKASYLVVADVATAARLAVLTKDSLMWTTESTLAPGIPLADAERTAAGVAELRDFVRSPSNEPPGPLRTGLVSGIEDVVASAVALRDATRERASLLAAAGAATGLLAVLVVALLVASDRRVELRHGAAIGLGPVRTAGTWLLEALVPVAIAVAGGVGLARLTLLWLGPSGTPSSSAVTEAVRAAAEVGLIALVVVAATAAVVVLASDRPQPAGRRRAFPWVALVVVIAATALLATATARSTSPGPVAILTPALVALAVGASVATVAARIGRSRRTSLPTSVGAAGRWLGRRRTTSGGTETVLPVAALSLGLGLVLVTATAVAGTRTAIADRIAVRSGAEAAVQITGTWELDPRAPHALTAKEENEGKRPPKPRPVVVPDGTTVVWRTLASLEGDFGYHDVMAIDPLAFGPVASWGQGQQLAAVRDLLPVLQDARDHPPTGIPSGTVPVIAVNDPSVRTGQLVVMSAQGWQVNVRVVATTDSFPGLGTRPLLVAPYDVLLPRWGRSDPRLAPPKDAVPLAYSETWYWSAGSVPGLNQSLEHGGGTVLKTTTPAQLGIDPALDAASRSLGYLVALAAFVALTSLVVLAEQARRTARRTRGADAMLERVGLGRRGVAKAQAWQLGFSVLVALVAAVITTYLVTPVGAALFDLDRTAHPAFEFRVALPALAITLGVAVVGFVVARVSASSGSRAAGAEEVVLRDG
jgi:putative ABC transport system permease protein